MTAAKQLWVLAGGNGAGKSTFYKTSLLSRRGVQFVNADMIANSISPESPEQVSYEAAHLVERLRDEFLVQGISFCFETVFSHESKIDFIARAKAQGYCIVLVYIHLNSVGLNEARVAQRVAQGGHDVPAEKIRSRLPRTLQNISAVLQLVDEARLLDNSYHDRPYQTVAIVKKGRRVYVHDPLPPWAAEMLRSIP
jgi:predicted ABC-type ATPase